MGGPPYQRRSASCNALRVTLGCKQNSRSFQSPKYKPNIFSSLLTGSGRSNLLLPFWEWQKPQSGPFKVTLWREQLFAQDFGLFHVQFLWQRRMLQQELSPQTVNAPPCRRTFYLLRWCLEKFHPSFCWQKGAKHSWCDGVEVSRTTYPVFPSEMTP